VNVSHLRRLVYSAASATLILAGSAAAGTNDVVELRIRGRYFAEPATIRVTIAVQPNQKNRTLIIEADGDRLFRSSQVSLDGENGQRIHTVEFKNLPAGHYVLRAEVRSKAELRGTAEEFLTVGDPGDQ
jgi:hypothetical protein